MTQYMMNNYNKSSTVSLDKYSRRKNLKPSDLKSSGGDSGNYSARYIHLNKNSVFLLFSPRF